MAEVYYVYTYEYPEDYLDKQLASTVFYVGKGQRDRIYVHMYEARKGVQSRKCDIIRSILAQGYKVVRKKVYITPVEQNAFIYEWALVNLIYRGEFLTNICEGGNGGYIRQHKLYKTVSVTLPSELSRVISKMSTHTEYIRELLFLYLSDAHMIEALKQVPLPIRKKEPGKIAYRHTMYLQLPLDIAANLELFPVMERSLIVEYLVRKDISLPLDN